LFIFEPSIKGKTEWKDETTLVFTPSRLLDPGKIYSGGLNLNKLSEVKERLKVFPLRIQTLRKDFRVTAGALECLNADGNSYILHGRLLHPILLNRLKLRVTSLQNWAEKRWM